MRKITVLALLLPLLLLIADCGGGTTSTQLPVTAPSAAPGAPLKINGYSATFTEHAVPGLTPGLGPFATTVGPDGIIWFAALKTLGSINGLGVTHLYNPGDIPDLGFNSIATGGDGGLWAVGQCCPGVEPVGTFMASFALRLSTSGVFTNLPEGSGQEFLPTFSTIIRAPGPGFVTIYNANNTSCYCMYIAPLLGPAGSLDFEFKEDFSWIEAAASSPDGFVYIRVVKQMEGALHRSYIAKIAPAPQGVVAQFDIPLEVHASGMIVGPDRNLWILESDRNAIARIGTSGSGFVEFPLPTPNAGLGNIVAAPDGALYFTEPQASKIGRITMQGQISEFPTPTANAAPTGISACPNLCEGAHVRLWFAEGAINKIGELQY